ncbi:Amino acid permease family protein [Candida parapsilosis]|uniref:Amino acid permease family protein n=1 Tax=Candida parapsilosis TaxID=5480 RepID=A0A8X7NR60_CANPA|nr:Amino acid permease family protein [Candida parapsilosis]KAF6049907.1 Amino acid permease family protein [Candida parapsilosis]KAF6057770.1 Amino acid permease family protein [Candida parapsilosis]KAF6065523.1 Amino acid permease family protein [Candida parapsilosis]
MWFRRDEKQSVESDTNSLGEKKNINGETVNQEDELFHDTTSVNTDKASSVDGAGHTKRTLYNRHLQLIAIGGSIGTGLFVTIGTTGLVNGGPLGLLLSYCISTLLILLLTTATGEMVSYMPVDAPFLNMAGRVIDPAFEAAASINFWIMQSLYIPFEITAVNGIIHFWRDDYSPAITFVIQIAIYAAINLYAVRVFGECEFWFSLAKLILCIGLMFFTLVTMCGGNPQHDAFGFRNWNVAGGPIGMKYTTGNLGRFQGFLASLRLSSTFTCVGSEYLSMTAGECVNPRVNMPIAFRTVLYRLVAFYIGGALSVSILIAYNDPKYVALTSDTSSAASSPYVVAMQNLGIQVLPHIVNAVVLTSAFSAGCSYTYTSSRCLYSLAIKGFVPKFFRICTKRGIPVYCVFVSCCFALLSLLQLGKSGSKALNYMVNLCTGAQVLNYGFMSIIYIGFYHAVKAQGIDRSKFPYRSWFQPYSIYFTAVIYWCIIGILGYQVFLPGMWTVDDFLFSYVMIFVSLAVFIVWKVVKRTKFIKPIDADLTTGLDEIEAHEAEFYAQLEESSQDENKSKWKGIMHWIF